MSTPEIVESTNVEGPAATSTPTKVPVEAPRTPQTHTPVRNRLLENLRKDQAAKSPLLQIPATPVMQRLGYGTGVGVYLLERSPRTNGAIRSPWAIKKTVKVTDTSDAYAERLEYEAEILKKLRHPNIIGYRAFGKTSPDKTFLAMEKANKSLADLIEERVEEALIVEDPDMNPVTPYPAKIMEKVSLDIAKALAYLHDEVKLVHGDVKSANVLVFGDFETVKLCDFGVSRKIAKDGTVEGNYVGTEIWNAMEVLRSKKGEVGDVKVTQKADIYPFGLIMHEMITLKPPHLSTAEESYLVNDVSTIANNGTCSDIDTTLDDTFDEDAFEEALAKYVGTRPPLPDIDFDSSYNTILGIFFCCTDEDATKRPDAKDIILALTELSGDASDKSAST